MLYKLALLWSIDIFKYSNQPLKTKSLQTFLSWTEKLVHKGDFLWHLWQFLTKTWQLVFIRLDNIIWHPSKFELQSKNALTMPIPSPTYQIGTANLRCYFVFVAMSKVVGSVLILLLVTTLSYFLLEKFLLLILIHCKMILHCSPCLLQVNLKRICFGK